MVHSIDAFCREWSALSGDTIKLLAALTAPSLKQAIAPGHRNLGRIAWHIVTTIPEMAGRTGLKIDGPSPEAPMPDMPEEIKQGYEKAAKSLLEQIKTSWSDADLDREDEMYGDKWKRSFTLRALMNHEIHHRGQMTILMRQAALKVPGIYGPALEDWAKFGLPAPEL